MTATIHTLRPHAPIRAIDEPSVRSYSEAFMRSLRTHADAERIPVHLYMSLVDVLDAIVTRIERNG
jgi:hypothetical protein